MKLATATALACAAMLAGCAAPDDTAQAPLTLQAPVAPPPEPPAPPPPPPEADPPLVLYYEPDVYAVREQDLPVLRAHAKRLIEHPQWQLRIEAHTDDTGALDYNVELARMRAQTVAKQLASMGVASARLQVVAPVKPARGAKAQSAEERAQSRRVDLTYQR
jgi:outer membrane protein OmpA-like peptidoglycan-associated protein